MTKQEFEEKYKGVIPAGKFKQVRIEEARKMLGGDTSHHDTSHEVSVKDKKTKTITKFGSFKHSHFAGFTEDLLNAYRNGDLVWKEECPPLTVTEEDHF